MQDVDYAMWYRSELGGAHLLADPHLRIEVGAGLLEPPLHDTVDVVAAEVMPPETVPRPVPETPAAGVRGIPADPPA